jgi:hypothetical protein
VSFAAITLCVAPERVFIVVSVHSFIDSVRKLLDTPFLCVCVCVCVCQCINTHTLHTEDINSKFNYFDTF